MNVVILTTSYPHDGDPVAGCFVRAMARWLVGDGHAVTVLCAGRPGAAPVVDPGVTVIAARGFTRGVFGAEGAPERLGLGASLNARELLRAIDSVLALGWGAMRLRGRAERVISHFVLPAGLVAGLVFGPARHLGVIHGTDGWLLAQAPRPVRAAVLACASRWWCTHRALWEALSGAATGCLVGSMPLEPLRALRRPPRPFSVVWVGRMVPIKRPAWAIAVGEALASRWPLRLEMLGDGPLSEHLAAAPWWVARGAVDATARDAALCETEIFLHTAGARGGWRREGAPMAVLEAMQAGCVVVAVDSGGVAELVGDAGVVLGADAGPAELAEAVAALWRDPGRRATLSARACARAKARSWEALGPVLREVLHEMGG